MDPIVEALYRKLRERAGDAGEAYNMTEYARAGKDVPELAGISPETLTQVNRYAQSADTPATALLAAPYEVLKGVEQRTGVPALSGPGALLNKLGVPVALPGPRTSKASVGNVTASLQGALRGLFG